MVEGAKALKDVYRGHIAMAQRRSLHDALEVTLEISTGDSRLGRCSAWFVGFVTRRDGDTTQ